MLEFDCSDSLLGKAGGGGLDTPGVREFPLSGIEFDAGFGAMGGFGATGGFGAIGGFAATSGLAANAGFGTSSGFESVLRFASNEGFTGLGGFAGFAGFGGGTFLTGAAGSGCASPPDFKRAISAAKLGAPDETGAGAAGASCSSSIAYGGGGEFMLGTCLAGRLG